jgi:ribonuclease R
MSVRIGQTLDGTVSGVGDFGIYVEEKTSKCEGMIRLKNLGNDFYMYDAKSMTVKGEKTGKEFKIGDRIQIEVLSADLELRQIDYKLKN